MLSFLDRVNIELEDFFNKLICCLKVVNHYTVILKTLDLFSYFIYQTWEV